MTNTAPFTIESAARTFTGRRSNNEDAFLAEPSLGLFAVADGMGGYEGGEVASGLAITAMRGFYKRLARDDNATWPFGLDPSLGLDENALAVAMRVADAEVSSQKRGRLSSMGSTVAAVAVRGGHVAIGHVGDSRVYRLRDGALAQLTRDHSLYEEMRATGMELPPRERFPHANVITRALGMCARQGPEVSGEALRAGDVYLLCTDGLLETLDEARIGEVLASGDPEAACEDLVTEAFERGARDNITAVVLRVR
ncbi:MAG: protein phosphatase 2C domain-containing protein [Polyangiales bacterium]